VVQIFSLPPLLLRLLLTLGSFSAFAYLSACLFLLVRQNRLIFLPSASIEVTPELFNLPYQEVWLPVPNGPDKVERIHGWWIPAVGTEMGVMLYLHGNGLNIGANAEQAHRFHQLGFAVLLIDYRGYGRSEGGFPAEAKVYQDAQVAWNYLTEERQIPPQRIFLYGHSLGGAIAIDLAAKHPQAAGLIVQSSFSSMQDVVNSRGRYWIFPVDLLLTQRFDSIAKVPSLRLPVLYVHGTADRQVPAQMSQALFAATPEPKQLLLVPEAGHNNVAEVGGLQYFQAIRQFVQQAQRQQQVAEGGL